MRDEPDSFAPVHRIVAAWSEPTDAPLRKLLHDRLRSCVAVLTVAFMVFVIQGSAAPTRKTVPTGFQAVVGGILGLAAVVLNGRVGLSMRQLRLIEAGTFGLLTAYVAYDQFIAMRNGVPDPEVEFWRIASFFKAALAYITALIFTYAIFIPNGWRRALGIFSTMASVPLATTAAVYATLREFRRLMAEDSAMAFENLGEPMLLLATSVGVAVFGVRTVNEYRREIGRERELNQYRLGRKLGSGGMGEVYLAEHRLLKRPCALKLISPRLTASETSRKRFELEVRATARLSHWNTVDVYDYGRTESGDFYYVMEYLPGLSLQEVVDRHGPLPAGRVIYLLRQVCEALREAHRAGLIHRDLKPPNIFAAYCGGRYDVAKVLDFGLVKSIGDDDSPLLTLEGVVTGSPLYMAPELIVKDRIPDGRADIYGLGAVAYFLLAGRPPFLGSDAVAVMMAHAHEPVVPPSRHEPSIPPDLEGVILRCLEKAPEDRYGDVEDLGLALKACRDAEGWSADLAEEWWQSRDPIDPDPEHSAGTADPCDSLPSLAQADFPGLAEPEAGPPADSLMTMAEDQPPPSGPP